MFASFLNFSLEGQLPTNYHHSVWIWLLSLLILRSGQEKVVTHFKKSLKYTFAHKQLSRPIYLIAWVLYITELWKKQKCCLSIKVFFCENASILCSSEYWDQTLPWSLSLLTRGSNSILFLGVHSFLGA